MDTQKTGSLVKLKTETSVSGGSGESPLAPDLSGKVIGGYQLVRMIAEGGMGVVYEAIQLNLSRRVAVKMLGEELAARP